MLINIFQKFREFINRPTHSRTTGLIMIFILVSTVCLTVAVAQQQQTIKQRAWFFGLCLNSNADRDCACNESCREGICHSYYDDGYPGALVQSFCETTDSGAKTGRQCMSGAHIATNEAGYNGVYTDWICDDSNSSYPSVCSSSVIAGYVISECSASCGFTTLISWDPPSSTCVPIGTSPTPILIPTTTPTITQDTCTLNGGRCIPMAPCVPPANANYSYSCGSNPGGTVCCTSCWNQTACYIDPDDYLAYRSRMTDGRCESNCGETSDTSSLCYDPACAGGPTPTIYIPPTAIPTRAPTPYVPPTAPPTSYPTSYPTITLTPTPAVITLVSALNIQDAPIPDSFTANLTLYSLTFNKVVTGAPATQTFTKTAIPDRQYSVNITLTNLAHDKYFIIIRKGNMIAKAVFTVSGSGTTVTVPTTTLVFGDVNRDNKIDIVDYNLFKNCWKQPAASSCSPNDFDQNGGTINEVDYNTWVRGLATWTKEGQGL